MEFTNFEQMNQMITMASGMLSQTLWWVLSGLVLGLSVCSIGGALGQCWLEARVGKAMARLQTTRSRVQRSRHSLLAGWAAR